MASSTRADPELSTRIALLRQRDGDDAWLLAEPTEGVDESGSLHVVLDAGRRVREVRVDRVTDALRTPASLLDALQQAWSAAEIRRVVGAVEHSPRRLEYERFGREVLLGTRTVDIGTPPPVTIPTAEQVRGAADRFLAANPIDRGGPAAAPCGEGADGRVSVTVGATGRPAALTADERWLTNVWPADLGQALGDALTAAEASLLTGHEDPPGHDALAGRVTR